MRNSEALKGHAHRHFIDIYTEENLNQVIARSYRECQRKVMRVDGIVVAGSEQCSLCLHKTSPISPLHCQQCDQVLKLCTHCIQYASKLHVHPIPRFNDNSSQGNPVQVQRSTSKPSPSGPQYSPATPSTQSPQPSQGPFGSAAPQPQRLAPGRPPTTGQTIPPRRQRISSAPPQGLWSRPQSYGPAPAGPYGATQQGAFLNDLTTSIAIASITQAVAGAESNAIYDGSGATGPTDAGNLDTGTAAADTTGAGATQDVSGVQGTDWTGQETWQDTTAVYDSGWATDDQALF
ncbi:uncharacterized protein Z519_01076 [Cladophialophora bantiana CBS 173.52]|uniref:Uncharacterized protein n=1 Tax=Cladophialophora bantiana (strain ATCC 10958 / CBS 173.52 / CDC B-1940 / NIH 8579) TaxID=1442370 RepID=A0A0D2GGM7_CLAB1|nr:uncharacterized protein Z519_01076 [Cladophialophora bantiana CBS 173.52]KIW97492.1 hypothetical protein Z519_01076 [Cladophialophora bantiana CBS 173.52]